MTLGQFFTRTPFIPLLVLALLIGVLYTSIRISGESPAIDRISPAVAYPGDQLTISGKHFGTSRGRSHVSIAGVVPTTAAYQQWTDTSIRLTIPDNITSGLVYVITDHGKSEGALLTNKQNIPETVTEAVPAGSPYIESVTPNSGTPGNIVTIVGRNFGMNRGSSRVDFQWVSLTPEGAPGTTTSDGAAATSAGATSDASAPGTAGAATANGSGPGASSGSAAPGSPVTASTASAAQAATAGAPRSADVPTISAQQDDFDYVYWSDREIHVRVPDGAASGDISVIDAKGRSNGVNFDVVHTVGTKTFRDRKTYSVRYGVEISDAVLNGTSASNALYLWVPRVQLLPQQRNLQMLSRTEAPIFENVNGLMLYRLGGVIPARDYKVELSYEFDRYAVETTIIPNRVRADYDTSSGLYLTYTEASQAIPSANDTIAGTARAIVGRLDNPYSEAQAVYNYLIKYLEPDPGQTDLLNALKSKTASDGVYAGLMVAMLRSLNVPARLDSGELLTDDHTAVPHRWLEFYINQFGWVPVDPSLADGYLDGRFTAPDDPVSYYFGNLDNRHFTFSRGVLEAFRMDPSGRPVAGADRYDMQTIREEATGNLSAYTSKWDDVVVTGTSPP